MATRIYVGNLPYAADNQQLTQLFRAFGDVIEAAVVMDRESGRSKGFGFVQMASDDAARVAIASLNGTMLDNRTIRVTEAQPRPERLTAPRSGGGFGSSYTSYSRNSGERPYRESRAQGEFVDARQDRYGRSRDRGW
jgi:RNA recognition motif-containing protein